LLYLGNAPDELSIKTARGLAFWRPQWCLGQYCGPDCQSRLDLPEMSFAAARAAGANTMVVGIANAGGVMGPQAVRDVVAAIARLKERPGGDLIVHGSCRLVDTLVQHGLVDEFHLMVYPIILGSGKRLFGDPKATARLELVDSKTLGDGVLLLTYRPATAVAPSAG